MAPRLRRHITDSEKALLWERWQQGESLHQIARWLGRRHSSIRRVIAQRAGTLNWSNDDETGPKWGDMDQLRRNLMLKESAARLQAADLLSGIDDSDSAYLLRLLGFELLLKVIYEETLGASAPRHHRYGEIFCALDHDIQASLLQFAGERIGPSSLTTDAIKVIDELGSNFIALRYPYEKYAEMSDEKYAQLGSEWLASGAKLEQATFRYHPEELLGLTWAAQKLAGGSV